MGSVFMPNYPQMASYFVHGENFNKQESMIFGSLHLREFSCWHILSPLSSKFEFPDPVPN